MRSSSRARSRCRHQLSLEDREGAEKTLVEVKGQGQRGLVVQADISEEEQVEKLFSQALDEFETLHILMNNAGVDASGKEVADLPTETWDRALIVNLFGTFFCCRRFINIRKAAGGGGKIIKCELRASRHPERRRFRLRLLEGSYPKPHQNPRLRARPSWHEREQSLSWDGLDALQPARDR